MPKASNVDRSQSNISVLMPKASNVDRTRATIMFKISKGSNTFEQNKLINEK